jgi:hypothetical protein
MTQKSNNVMPLSKDASMVFDLPKLRWFAAEGML